MENIIYKISGAHFKSFALTNNEIWVSSNNCSTLEKLQKSTYGSEWERNGYHIQLNSINEISYNESSNSVKFSFTDKQGKTDNLKVNFDNKSISTGIANYLGNKLNLNVRIQQESKFKAMWPNAKLVIILILISYSISKVGNAKS